MTAIDERLARKGKGQPRRAVLQQARVLQALVVEHGTTLAGHGWDADDSVRFATNIALAEAALGGRSDTANDADQKTKGEQAALDDAKGFLRRLRWALPRVIRDNPDAGVSMASFALDAPLTRSTPRMVAYLIKIRPAVTKLDAALKKHFGGAVASALLDAAKTALENADTEQETAHAAGPVETRALNEAIGRLLEDIEDVVRAGKSAFDGNATMMSRFNKDLILRARGRKPPEEAPQGDTTTP